MLRHSRILPLFLLIVGIIFLTQCTKIHETNGPLPAKRPLAMPFTMPAAAYLALSKNQIGEEHESLLIMSAGRLIYDGQWQQGLSVLSQTSNLSGELLDEKNVLLAKVETIREQPKIAIQHLAAVHEVKRLPVYYQVQFHELLASAYQAVGNTTESVTERIKLQHLLPDEVSQSNNARALWLTLTTLPPAELDTLSIEASENSELSGWTRLAKLSHRQYNNPEEMLRELTSWQAYFPDHPGNRILPSPLLRVKSQLFAPPHHMALLLPLTGPLAGPGHAIQDGFMAAAHESLTGDKVSISVYDTNAGNAAALYRQALAAGADYVVGPLSKTEVAAVAAMDHPVPTLLLNDSVGSTSDNAYSFGLSPSNEAKQVAAKIRKSGYGKALVIAPEGDWGNDIIFAFEQQWKANGGVVVDTLRYRANDDLGLRVRDILHLSDSEGRGKRLKQLLGSHVEAAPRRRQDFDVIFMLAYPTKARQIMPMLKYYYAGDVPVYATSTVYGGNSNPMKDKDLDGVTFGDMPWVFEHSMSDKHWPEQFNSYSRLYALGMDSYTLATQLNQLVLFPTAGVKDKRGVLYLSSTHQISRILVFGQFKQGQAQLSPSNN